jgi:hypothetical protein
MQIAKQAKHKQLLSFYQYKQGFTPLKSWYCNKKLCIIYRRVFFSIKLERVPLHVRLYNQ